MTRATLSVVFALLFSLAPANAATRQKGPGCWRTATARQKAAARMAVKRPVDIGERTNYRGQKRGLVILAEFSDTKFKDTHNRAKYNDILNSPGYTTNEGFRGSVADYFRDQSAGLFELQFDVVGPYTTKHSYRYYGKNDDEGLDLYPQDMIEEMCIAADGEVDFSNYDWDGDGIVDEVFVLYAGKGEADNSPSKPDLVWPHMWTLSEANGAPLRLDGVDIDVYACANELAADGTINGIGTFCHEFSHCMGFPDFYDINYGDSYGMGDYDLMSGGNYAGNGFLPVGYTAYEKMVCGWQEPVVLGHEDVSVDSLKPISEHGDTYIIYNDGCPDEYYMIENRQRTGWDARYPSRGLLITHVDFDAEVWFNNIPNTIMTDEEAYEMELTCGNDHQRMTFFHADNTEDDYSTRTDLYPYGTRDSLTTTSRPAAKLFNNNSEGQKLMQGAILNIKQNSDGTMAFSYRAPKAIADAITQHPAPDTQHPTPFYDLQGRRVSRPVRGLYIVGGRKVVVR